MLSPEILQKLSEIVGDSFVFTDQETRNHYGHDETEDLSFPPDVVLRPANTLEISSILKLCNAHKIPVTVRGGGSGLSGAALAVQGGVCLSMERLNQILHIDEQYLQVNELECFPSTWSQTKVKL